MGLVDSLLILPYISYGLLGSRDINHILSHLKRLALKIARKFVLRETMHMCSRRR